MIRDLTLNKMNGENVMNTKQLLMTMAVAAALSAPAAMADSTTAGQNGKAQHEQKFGERKAKILQRLEKRAAEIQQKQSCVQAATDHKSLKSCLPNMGKRGERGERGEERGDK
jgi:hypothetical protein